MKILLTSVEVAPTAKVGGLADVACSLPKALIAAGHDVRIAMPAYGMSINDRHNQAQETGRLSVSMNPSWHDLATLYRGSNLGVPTMFVGGRGFEHINRSTDLYSRDRDDYLFFSRSLMHACEADRWIPDVVHANDWHTGFLPVMVRELGGELWQNTSTVFTIHNLAYQGTFGFDTLMAAGLSHTLFTPEKLECWGGVNFLKSGCVYADQVNTVSPTYAREIQTEEFGCGLHGLMQDLGKLGKLRGILNGIDWDEFNPATDAVLPHAYDATSFEGKLANKAALQAEIGFEIDSQIPLVGMVTRLSDQKGFDLIVKAAYGLMTLPIQLVILAVGDPNMGNKLHEIEREWPDRFRFYERFDLHLGNRIYGGSDAFLMPSAFEPCGLGQLIAMRYGTLPIVRRTGGLADTVTDGVNGFEFEKRSAREMLSAVGSMCQAYANREKWTEMLVTALGNDSTWNASAGLYEQMYRDAQQSRQAAALVSH